MENTQTQSPSYIRSKEEIKQIVDLWRQSGKNKKQFCRENNIVYMAFIGWTAPKKSRKLSGTKEKPSGFVPIRVNQALLGVFAEINLPGGSKVIFHSPVSAQYLKDILR